MYLCKHPVYDKQLKHVGINLFFDDNSDESDQLFELEQYVQSVLNTVSHSCPLFVPYQLKDQFRTLCFDNPLIFIADAKKIGSSYSIEQLSKSSNSIALYMHDVKDLAYLNAVDYVGLSTEIIEKNNVTKLVKYVHDKRHKVIAFDVNNQAKFRLCSKLSMDYYCGNFLYQPDYKEASVSANKINLLNLINQLQDEDVSFQHVSEIINNDPTLSYELLKVANSAAFSRNRKIESIQQAVVRMGFLNLKNLVLAIAMKNVNDKPIELIESGLIRAHMCQDIATQFEMPDPEMYYTAGLLSIIDILLDKPMHVLLKKTSLVDELKVALLEREGDVGRLLSNVIDYEQANWNNMKLDNAEVDWCKFYISGMNAASDSINAMKH